MKAPRSAAACWPAPVVVAPCGGGGALLDFNAPDFRDNGLGEATEAAVQQTAEKLIAAKVRLLETSK